MNKMLLVLFLAVFSAAQTPGSAQTAVLAPVHQFVDGFNKGDAVPGPARSGWPITRPTPRRMASPNGVVTLSNPSHVDVSADRAYLVMPANYTFKQKGTPITEVGSILTLTLQKSQTGWRFTGWSWAKH